MGLEETLDKELNRENCTFEIEVDIEGTYVTTIEFSPRAGGTREDLRDLAIDLAIDEAFHCDEINYRANIISEDIESEQIEFTDLTPEKQFELLKKHGNLLVDDRQLRQMVGLDEPAGQKKTKRTTRS